MTPKTAAKWVRRFRRPRASTGSSDRSSRPHRSPRATSPELVDRVIELRRQTRPGYQIARAPALSPATVSRILRRVRSQPLARPASALRPSCATSTPSRAICSTSISRALPAISRFLMRADGRRRGLPKHPAPRPCTSPSTTTPAWPLPRLLPDQKAQTTIALSRAMP